MQRAAVALSAGAVEDCFALLLKVVQLRVGIRERCGTGADRPGQLFDPWRREERLLERRQVIEHSRRRFNRHLCLREERAAEGWPDTFVEDANLTVNISMLRKALGEGASEHQYIETVPGRGYRFVSTVTRVNNERADLLLEARGNSQAIIEDDGIVEGQAKKSAAGERPASPHGFPAVLPRGRGFSPVVVGLSALLIGLSLIAYYTWTKRAGHGLRVRSIAVRERMMRQSSNAGIRLRWSRILAARTSSWEGHTDRSGCMKKLWPNCKKRGCY